MVQWPEVCSTEAFFDTYFVLLYLQFAWAFCRIRHTYPAALHLGCIIKDIPPERLMNVLPIRGTAWVLGLLTNS